MALHKKVVAEGGKGGKNFQKPKSGSSTKPPARSQPAISVVSNKSPLSLPEIRSEPATSLEQCTMLLYGEVKIGKTSLAGKYPEAFHLFFEPGGKGLRLYDRPVNNWSEFKGYIELLLSTDRFRTVVLDTVDIAYDLCFDYICNKEGISHPKELEYGEGWRMVSSEFVDTMNILTKSGRGVVYIAHATTGQFQSRTGGTYNKIIPDMKKQARSYMTGIADIIAYYGYYGNRRFITVSGSDELDAGHRLEENFRTVDGKPVHSIPCFNTKKPDDRSFRSQETYDALVRAFDNKQEKSWEPEEDTLLSDTRAKRGSK